MSHQQIVRHSICDTGVLRYSQKTFRPSAVGLRTFLWEPRTHFTSEVNLWTCNQLCCPKHFISAPVIFVVTLVYSLVFAILSWALVKLHVDVCINTDSDSYSLRVSPHLCNRRGMAASAPAAAFPDWNDLRWDHDQVTTVPPLHRIWHGRQG